MVSSCPDASSRTAVFGLRSISFSKALEVLPLERLSKYLPKVIRVRIMPADSKYRFMVCSSAKAGSPWPKPYPITYRL